MTRERAEKIANLAAGNVMYVCFGPASDEDRMQPTYEMVKKVIRKAAMHVADADAAKPQGGQA